MVASSGGSTGRSNPRATIGTSGSSSGCGLGLGDGRLRRDVGIARRDRRRIREGRHRRQVGQRHRRGHHGGHRQVLVQRHAGHERWCVRQMRRERLLRPTYRLGMPGARARAGTRGTGRPGLGRIGIERRAHGLLGHGHGERQRAGSAGGSGVAENAAAAPLHPPGGSGDAQRLDRRVVVADERRRDAEDPGVERGFRLEADARARRHDVSGAPRMLGEIARELVAERGLEVREARAVAGTQETVYSFGA